MKVAIIILSLVALGCSAPQPRKLFHEHFDDFMDVIFEEAGGEIAHLMDHYVEFEEFTQTLEYIRTANFKNLIYEMESLPEFKAVIDFLENDNIDIHYFLDFLNEKLEDTDRAKKSRHQLSGTSLSAYIEDTIKVLPKDKLAALFEQKKEEDEEFRVAIENLESEEWDQTFGALWENEVFQKEVQTLAENGVDLHVLITEVKAIFGQN